MMLGRVKIWSLGCSNVQSQSWIEYYIFLLYSFFIVHCKFFSRHNNVNASFDYAPSLFF